MHTSGDLGRIDLGLADLIYASDKKWITGQELGDAEAAGDARENMMTAVRRGDVAQDFGDGADAAEIVGPRCLDQRVGLQQNADRLVYAGCGLGAGDEYQSAETERGDHTRKQHGVA